MFIYRLILTASVSYTGSAALAEKVFVRNESVTKGWALEFLAASSKL